MPEWYDLVFEVIDMRSFSNLWYWIALATVWSMASHWVLGVPFDMLTRARRKGGQAMDDLEEMARLNVTRLLYIDGTAGLWLTGFTLFVLAALGTLGFWYGIEFAQALFFILFPMSLVGLLSVRAARRIAHVGEGGEVLCRQMIRHRLVVQVIGMVSIFVTAIWGMAWNLDTGPW